MRFVLNRSAWCHTKHQNFQVHSRWNKSLFVFICRIGTSPADFKARSVQVGFEKVEQILLYSVSFRDRQTQCPCIVPFILKCFKTFQSQSRECKINLHRWWWHRVEIAFPDSTVWSAFYTRPIPKRILWHTAANAFAVASTSFCACSSIQCW